MILIPRATEKAYSAESLHTYLFFVPKTASKTDIARAVSAEYQVTVTNVRIANRRGKATRFSRGKHAYPGTTFRADRKLAYVTLKDTDKIPIFEEKADTAAAEAVAKTEKAPKTEEKGDHK